MNDETTPEGTSPAYGRRRRATRGGSGRPAPSAGGSSASEGGASRPRRSSAPRRTTSDAPVPGGPEPEAVGTAKALLTEILGKMGIGEVEIAYIPRPEGEYLEVRGDELGNLIGRHGNTLEALNLIFNNIINVGVRNNRRYYSIDAEGYRARRADLLKTQALEALERVMRDRKALRLEPMLPSERKIIHLALADSPFVTTESEGEEPERRVVVSPK